MNWSKEELLRKGYTLDGKRISGGGVVRGVGPSPSTIASPAPGLLTSKQIQTDEEKLNKTEKSFLSYLRIVSPQPCEIYVQAITLKLADDTRYTCDLYRISPNGIEGFEVKGFWRDDAKVKIKVAARMFSWIKFYVVMKNKSGGWNYTPVRP